MSGFLHYLGVSIVSEFHLQWIETHSSRWRCTEATGGYRNRTKYFKDRRTAEKEPRKWETIATSILGFCCCGLQLYLMFGVYSFYSKVKAPSPWPWLFFHTGFRLVEFCMACTIAYSVMQPSEPRNMNNGGHT